MAIGAVVGLHVCLVVMALLTFIQLGLLPPDCKVDFRRHWKVCELMRPLLLGWFVNCLILIPVAGTLLASNWLDRSTHDCV